MVHLLLISHVVGTPEQTLSAMPNRAVPEPRRYLSSTTTIPSSNWEFHA
jgi:hypothetical protein